MDQRFVIVYTNSNGECCIAPPNGYKMSYTKLDEKIDELTRRLNTFELSATERHILKLQIEVLKERSDRYE